MASTSLRLDISELPNLSNPSGSLPAFNISESPMRTGRKCSVGIISTILSYFTLSTIHGHFDKGGNVSELLEESRWIASSHSWWDRQSCRWLGICGATHLNKAGWTWKTSLERDRQQQLSSAKQGHHQPNLPSFWLSGEEDPDTWSQEEKQLREVPQYVFDHAPYVHLFSGEQFWPCDIAEHLVHTSPFSNYTPIEGMDNDRNLDNLDELNEYGQRGRFVYLQSDDNVEERPNWLGGSKNIPETPGDPDSEDDDHTWPPPRPPIDHLLPDAEKASWYEVGIGDIKENGGIRPNPSDSSAAVPTDISEGEEIVHEARKRSTQGIHHGGHSSAPVVLVVVPKGKGVVDAFWFYFYSYNLGNQVLNVRFGNHVGDWEHSVVRFEDGKPQAVFLSEHNFGEAYSYDAVEKIGKRPVVYSAVGTHAMYATPGLHPYVLPWGLLHDQTDRGPLWDPLLNAHAYTYNYTTRHLRSSTQTPHAPTSWFHFSGHWGDKFYPLSDPRQYRFAGQYHYVNGPLGPRFKNLGRKKVCQGNERCVIKHWLGPGDRARRWLGTRPGEELEERERDEQLGEMHEA
ncbi:Vacuolar protein sorting-associated protein 62 [Zalaria obscura]|uniref:Vacuolar protein sorting-associated protein 62 n=1 Tax=Zalaria obscura TaxID=2024903 RepID=A0ACC3SDV4_9PEZI